MRIISRPRGAGKTTDLIKRSAASWLYIVTLNHKEACRIRDQAEKMGLKIPYPLTAEEWRLGAYDGIGVRGLLLDNAEQLLQQISHVPVEAITMTGPSQEWDT